MIGLVRANDIAPGTFLTPPQYKQVYRETRFNTEMGSAATQIAASIRGRRDTWTVADMHTLLRSVADTRASLGGKAGLFYGYPVPTRPDEVEAPHRAEATRIPPDQRPAWSARVFRLWGMLRDFLAIQSQIDRTKVSGTSHRAIMTVDEPPGAWCHLDIGPERLALSVLVRDAGAFVLAHPSYERMARIRDVGYDLLLRALDSDPLDLDTMARSYQLLIHATPWFNGTAAIIETFFDAIVRAHGWAFPPKTSEPYFDAVFHTSVYTWRDLISNFDGTPKPLVLQVL